MLDGTCGGFPLVPTINTPNSLKLGVIFMDKTLFFVQNTTVSHEVISHGNSAYSSTHPYLHIKADIPTNEIKFFMEFIKSYLKTKYPKLTAHCGSLICDLDNLKAGLYNLNQSVKYYNEQDIQDGNYII